MTDIVLAIFNEQGLWAVILYIFFKDLLPKISPQYFKFINKHISREDRLFEIIKEKNQSDEKIAVALTKVSETLTNLSHRIEKVEEKIK